MYYLLYEDAESHPFWEVVSGEDAMQERVNELMSLLNCSEDDIIVFNSDDQL